MTGRNRLTILVDAKNQASSQLRGVAGDVSSIAKSIEDGFSLDGALGALGQLSPTLGGLATAATGVGAAIGAWQLAQGTMELGRLGAGSLTLKKSFNELAQEAGSSGSAMLGALKTASKGAIDNQNLMVSANRSMMLEVAGSAEEMSALMAVAVNRGKALGLGAQQAFDNLVTGLGRASPEILDNLAIMVDSEQVFGAYAASLGKTADALTAAERKQALVNVVLAEGRQLMSEQGGQVDDAALAFERMDAALANAKSALGELFAPAVAVVAENIARAAEAAATGIETVAQAGTLAPATIDSFTTSVVGLNQQLEQGALSIDGHAANLLSVIERLDTADEATLQTAFSLQMLALAVQSGSIGYDEYVRRVDELIDSQARLKGQIDALAGTYPAAGMGVAGYGQATEYAAKSSNFATTQLDALGAGLRRVIADFGAANARAGEFSAGASRAGGALSDVNVRAIGAATGLRTVMGAFGAAGAAANAMAAQVANAAAQLNQFIASSAAGLASELVSTKGADAALTVYRSMNTMIGGQVEKWKEAGYSMEEIEGVLLPGYISGLRKSTQETVRLASGTGAVRSAVAQTNQEYENLKSTVSSVLSGAFNDIGGVKLDEMLPRQDSVSENARRLADVAVHGFKSPWTAYFQQEFPSLWQELNATGDIQSAAAQMLRDFQDGLRPELIDKDRAKGLVKRALLGDQNKKELIDEISKELAAELGVSIQEAQKAAAGALGGSGGLLSGVTGGETGKLSITPELDTTALSAAPVQISATISVLEMGEAVAKPSIDGLIGYIGQVWRSNEVLAGANLPSIDGLIGYIGEVRRDAVVLAGGNLPPIDGLTGYISSVQISDPEALAADGQAVAAALHSGIASYDLGSAIHGELIKANSLVGEAGKSSGAQWGSFFLSSVRENGVPDALINLLTDLVDARLTARQGKKASQSAAS